MFAGLGAGGTAAIGGAGAYIGSSLGLPPAISGLASAGAAASAAKAGTGIMSKAGLSGGLAGAGIGAAVTAVAVAIAAAVTAVKRTFRSVQTAIGLGNSRLKVKSVTCMHNNLTF